MLRLSGSLTERALAVKVAWPFTSTLSAGLDAEAQRRHDEIATRVAGVLRRSRDAGQLPPDTDLVWARQVYYALIDTTARHTTPDDEPAALADRLLRAFLGGLGAGGSTRRGAAP